VLAAAAAAMRHCSAALGALATSGAVLPYGAQADLSAVALLLPRLAMSLETQACGVDPVGAARAE